MKSKQRGTGRAAYTLEPLENRLLLTASIVRDIGKNDANAYTFGANQGLGFVRMSLRNESDYEYWVTDGSFAGTHSIPDTRSSGSVPSVVFSSKVIYPGSDGGSGTLVASDGTSQGTNAFWTAGAQRGIASTAVAGNRLYWLVKDYSTEISTWELWTCDAALAQPRKLGTLPGTTKESQPLNPVSPLIVAGKQLFYLFDGQIYSIDPKSGAATRVARFKDDIDKVFASSTGLYFVTHGTKQGSSLWRADGSADGTQVVSAFTEKGSGHGSIFRYRGSTWFSGYSADIQSLFRIDESDPDHPAVVRMLDLDAAVSSFNFAPFKKYLIFRSIDSSSREFATWRTDGTPAGTIRLSRDGFTTDDYYISNEFVSTTACVFYTAYTIRNGLELWKTDGTKAGTAMVSDIYSGGGSSSPYSLRSIGDKVLFTASDLDYGRELWVSDGTAAGTHIVKEFAKGNEPSGNITSIQTFGKWTFFGAKDWSNGPAMWVSDGTKKGTRPLVDSDPGPFYPLGPSESQVSPSSVYEVGQRFVFFDGGARSLWVFDGKSVAKLPFSSREPIGVVGGKFYFRRYGGTYETDGTLAGTRLLPYPEVDEIGKIAVAGGRLFFPAHSEKHGWELWRESEDGKHAELIKEINAGSADSIDPDNVELAGGELLYFTARLHNDRELWRSDGTAEGTFLLKDLEIQHAGVFGELRIGLKVIGTTCYFGYPPTGDEWKTDGTVSGTQRLANQDMAFWSRASDATVNGRRYFGFGDSLWIGDGTVAGSKVAVKFDGNGLPAPEVGPVQNSGSKLYFGVTRRIGNSWVTTRYISDGTSAGTRVIEQDLPAGAESISIDWPDIAADGSQWFVATTDKNGAELWRTPPG